MGALCCCCILSIGIVPAGGVGGNEGLRFGEGAAIVFEVAGEELIAGKVGVGSADVLTIADAGEGALRWWGLAA